MVSFNGNRSFLETIHKRNKVDLDYTIKFKNHRGIDSEEKLFVLIAENRADENISSYLLANGVSISPEERLINGLYINYALKGKTIAVEQ